MTISAACTVKDGAGSPVATLNGVNVTPANTITIALASVSGADIWEITLVGTDELVAVPALTINPTTKTATFTAPAAGSALRFQSTVEASNARDPATGRAPYRVTETFGIYALIGGKRVKARGETFEGNATYGWIGDINAIIRAGGGGGATPTGTGFRHVTAGAEDGAAALVVNADVSASAAIVGSKLAASLALTTSVAAGTNAAAGGAVRIPSAQLLRSRNNANGGDLDIAGYDASDTLILGDGTGGGGITYKCYSGGIHYFRLGSNDTLAIRADSIRCMMPITGEDSFYTTPYSAHGSATVAEGDTTRTEVAGIYKYTNIIYTGAMTAGRTVTFPLPASLAASYHKTIFNNTTGGFAITLANGGGATIAIAAGKTALVAFEPAGARRLTADV